MRSLPSGRRHRTIASWPQERKLTLGRVRGPASTASFVARRAAAPRTAAGRRLDDTAKLGARTRRRTRATPDGANACVNRSAWGFWLRRPLDLASPLGRLPREVRPVPAVAVFPSGRRPVPDGFCLCVGLSAVAGRDSPLRGCPARASRVSVREVPRSQTRIPFAWENRPPPDENPLCVDAPATQVAFPSGRCLVPDGIALCVGLASVAGRDLHLCGCPGHASRISVREGSRAGRKTPLCGKIARGRTRIPFAWEARPRRSRFCPGGASCQTGLCFAWENHPRNCRSRLGSPEKGRRRVRREGRPPCGKTRASWPWRGRHGAERPA